MVRRVRHPRRAGSQAATGPRARRRGEARRRAEAVALALAAMRSGTLGMALLRGARLLVRNPAWDVLEGRAVAEWRPEGAERPRRRCRGLEEVAAGLARSLARGTRPVKVARYEQPDTGRVVEMRLERLGRARQPTVAVIVEDVTERVSAERELARARQVLFDQERMRAVGELASGIAHDLNNALHAMAMRLGRLQRSPAAMAEQGPNVEALVRIVGDAAARVARLQELGQQRRDVPQERLDLGKVIADALEVARPDLEELTRLAHRPISIEADLPDLPAVAGSAPELRHVFLNLLVNARDAMPRGGQIRIQARHEGGWVVVTLADEGTGIAPGHLGRVFDPFFTTKGTQGTGLGLSIAYSVMRRLGGSISAANRPEGGAVFTLTFPVAAPVERAEPPRPAPAAAPPGRHVLVVDDDDDNLEATRWVLEGLGQRVSAARSGAEALAVLAEGGPVDLVLCDIGMPGLDGWEVAERIQQIRPGTRTFLISGWASEIAPDDPRLRSVRGVLPKPLDLDRLERLLGAELSAAAAPVLPPGATEASPER